MRGTYQVAKGECAMKIESAEIKIQKIEHDFPVPVLNVVQSDDRRAPEYVGVAVIVTDEGCSSVENDVALLRSYLAQAYLAISTLTQRNEKLKELVKEQDRKLLLISTELEKSQAERKQAGSEYLDRPKSPLAREFANLGLLIGRLHDYRSIESEVSLHSPNQRQSFFDFEHQTEATIDVAKQIIEHQSDENENVPASSDDASFLKNELKLKTRLIQLFQKSFKEMTSENVKLQESVATMRTEVEKKASELVELNLEKIRIGNQCEELKSVLRREDERIDEMEERYEKDKVMAMNYGISKAMDIIEELISSEMRRKTSPKHGSLDKLSTLSKKKPKKEHDEFLMKLQNRIADVLGPKGDGAVKSDDEVARSIRKPPNLAHSIKKEALKLKSL